MKNIKRYKELSNHDPSICDCSMCLSYKKLLNYKNIFDNNDLSSDIRDIKIEIESIQKNYEKMKSFMKIYKHIIFIEDINSIEEQNSIFLGKKNHDNKIFISFLPYLNKYIFDFIVYNLCKINNNIEWSFNKIPVLNKKYLTFFDIEELTGYGIYNSINEDYVKTIVEMIDSI